MMALPNPQALTPDSTLGKFRIRSLLAEGGFAFTYLAEDEILKCPVVIKEYLPQQFASRINNKVVAKPSRENEELFIWGKVRFLSEAQTIAKLVHRNIVRIREFFETNDTAYIVMDYEQGCSLSEAIRTKSLPLVEQSLINDIIYPLLDGLRHIHNAGILHRDIKPANIFLRSDFSPVLIDFGSARTDLKNRITGHTVLVSHGYSPPEQYANSSEQGPWTDIYSLGATLFEVLTNQPPLKATSRDEQSVTPVWEQLHGKYSDSFLTAIDWALTIDASSRPQTVDEFRNAFDMLSTSAHERGSPTLIESSEIPQSKSLQSSIATAAAIVCLCVGTLAYLYLSNREADLKSVENSGQSSPHASSSPAEMTVADAIQGSTPKEGNEGNFKSVAAPTPAKVPGSDKPLNSNRATNPAKHATDIFTLTSNLGSSPVYGVGDLGEFTVAAAEDIYVLCFYEPSAGEVYKIFPNAFQTANFVARGQSVTFPDSNDYSIRFDRNGVTENFLCMSSKSNLNKTIIELIGDSEFEKIDLSRLSDSLNIDIKTIDDLKGVTTFGATSVVAKNSLRVTVE